MSGRQVSASGSISSSRFQTDLGPIIRFSRRTFCTGGTLLAWNAPPFETGKMSRDKSPGTRSVLRHAIPFRLAIRMTATWDQPDGCQYARLPGGGWPPASSAAAISRYEEPSARVSRMRSTTRASKRATRRAIVALDILRFSGLQVRRFAMGFPRPCGGAWGGIVVQPYKRSKTAVSLSRRADDASLPIAAEAVFEPPESRCAPDNRNLIRMASCASRRSWRARTCGNGLVQVPSRHSTHEL